MEPKTKYQQSEKEEDYDPNIQRERHLNDWHRNAEISEAHEKKETLQNEWAKGTEE